MNRETSTTGTNSVSNTNSTTGTSSTSNSNINNTSIVAWVKYKDTELLLCGDAEKEVEERLVGEYGKSMDCDIIKVGHHGSSTSSDEDFIKCSKPETAVICVGKDNHYGHPDSAVVGRLEEAGADICRTDEMGTFIIEKSGEHCDIQKYRGQREYVCR